MTPLESGIIQPDKADSEGRCGWSGIPRPRGDGFRALTVTRSMAVRPPRSTSQTPGRRRPSVLSDKGALRCIWPGSTGNLGCHGRAWFEHEKSVPGYSDPTAREHRRRGRACPRKPRSRALFVVGGTVRGADPTQDASCESLRWPSRTLQEVARPSRLTRWLERTVRCDPRPSRSWSSSAKSERGGNVCSAPSGVLTR
jgi:hypothetical protein